MVSQPPAQELLVGKKFFIGVVFAAVALFGFAIWSLVAMFGGAAGRGAGAPVAAAGSGRDPGWDALPAREMIEREHAAYRPPPVPAPLVLPTNAPPAQPNAEIVLQQRKARVNQQLIERLKKYVRDHPERDNRELEKEIKRREQQLKSAP